MIKTILVSAVIGGFTALAVAGALMLLTAISNAQAVPLNGPGMYVIRVPASLGAQDASGTNNGYQPASWGTTDISIKSPKTPLVQNPDCCVWGCTIQHQ